MTFLLAMLNLFSHHRFNIWLIFFINTASISASRTNFFIIFPSLSSFKVPLSLALLTVACFVIITVLISLQFPVIMSSPWAALSFATCFTAVLGSAAMLVGDEIAPLPLYALIMVGIELDNLIASYFRSINFSLPFQFVIAFRT
jgi:adenylate cyclase 2